MVIILPFTTDPRYPSSHIFDALHDLCSPTILPLAEGLVERTLAEIPPEHYENTAEYLKEHGNFLGWNDKKFKNDLIQIEVSSIRAVYE